MTDCLNSIRNCLEGFVPAIMATVDVEGVPNVAIISQVQYVDPMRVALSYQFFNKTRRNFIETRMASVQVNEPLTCERFQLDLEFEGTQTFGPHFEAMKAKLAGIASHLGMHGVFKLLGSDIFRVRSISPVPGSSLTLPPSQPLMSAVHRVFARLSEAETLSELFDETMVALRAEFGIEHAILLMLDEAEGRLCTVAATGYSESESGSQILLGEGVIGVAAREGAPIRIGSMTLEYSYGDTVRETARRSGLALLEAREIPYPGLASPQSQLALPIRCGARILGVLFVESQEPMRFWHDEEDALGLVTQLLGTMIKVMKAEDWPAKTDPGLWRQLDERSLKVRRYEADNSIFLDHEYLIKGVAGAILWKLLIEHSRTGRTEFTNRELRLDPALRLPNHSENLEARLILLTRRLAERSNAIGIERAGRGRIRLVAGRRLTIETVAANERVSTA